MFKYKRYSNHLYDALMMLVFLSAVSVFVACSNSDDKTSSSYGVHQAEISKLREQGEQARRNSQFDKSIKIHIEEFKLAESIADTLSMVKALNNIGTNYRRLGVLDDAARYHNDALMLTLQNGDPQNEEEKKCRLMALNGLGNIYLSLGDLHQADSIFRESLKGEKELKSPLGQAINLANIGSVMEKLGQTDSAWAYFRYSLAMNKQARSKLGEALCFSHFASLHEQEGKYDEAIDEYRHAYDIMEDSPDDWHKLEAGVNVAKLYIQQGNYARAHDFLKQVDATATRIHSLDHRSRIHLLYYQLYEKQGNLRAALDNYIVSAQLRDSLIDMKKVNQIQNIRLQLEREETQTLLDQANERYRHEHFVKTVTISLLVVIIIVAIAIISTLWYTLRERSKTHRILKQMNKSREDFFANIAMDPADLQSAESVVSEQDRKFIGRFVDVVYSQMSKGKTDVESVAEQLSMSRAQLNRRILAITGQNTLTYITQIRISKAKRLLRADLSTPIGDIANKCGFDDVAYFSRLFKQQTDMTPSQYRKMI